MPDYPSQSSALSVVIVTGLSGSGKSTALAVFEDMGFFTVDGLPAAFASKLISLLAGEGLEQYNGIALGMDMRQSGFGRDYEQALVEMNKLGYTPNVLFFEAKPEVLLKRYATTRRPHPLEKEGLGLEQALELERSRMRHQRATADLVFDTSSYSIHDLRRSIQEKFKSLSSLSKSLKIHIISFGFKYGSPSEADMLFDLRFLPNPFFIPELKALSGLDAPVSDYVIKQEPGRDFLARLTDFLSWTLQQYEREGRFRLTIAIGCTGGRHRSVAVSEALAQALKSQEYSLSIEHRHLNLG
ncbi:RNase adapter RapZ [Desulfovibrio sp. OttesenSCG-928-F20]|nr:RNase adapter RapZ [Desulfovibrio sp. OttesenSCG-928-M16]MDL2290591.1 RNase adapter RapZ [Desulfovibrio sp. OttesenSCG-928-F20]